MAIQILPQSQSLGEALGTGLGQGLQNLALLKIQDLQKQQQSARIAPGLKHLFPDLSNDQLMGLASADPKVLSQIVKQRQMQQEGRPVSSAVEEVFRGAPTTPSLENLQMLAPQIQQAQQEPEINQQRLQEQLNILNAAKSIGLDPSNLQNLMQNLYKQPISGTSELQRPREEIKPTAPTFEAKPIVTQLPPGLKADKLDRNLELTLQRRNLTPEQQENLREKIEKKTEKLRLQQEKIESKLDPYVKEIKQKASAAKEDLERLNEMEQLVKGGNLANPVAAAGLETLSKGLFGIGIDLFGLTSKDTQRFRKLSKDFAKTAKNFFGARVTEGEIKLLLDTFPTLSQSDAGKLAIIDKLKPLTAASQVYDQALEEVLAQYNYQAPTNLRSLVEKKVKPRLDQLAKEFRESARIRDLDRKLRAEGQRRKEPVKAFLRGFIPGAPERLLGIGEPED